MQVYEVTRDIDAPGEVVWSILTDAARMTSWDSGVARVEGSIAAGEKLKVFSELNPKRAFPVRVTEFDPPRSMTWTGGMPLGLFKGVRTFRIVSEGQNSTFHMREEFTGPLQPLVGRSMPDLTPSFEQFANGLKAVAEAESPG